MRVILTGITGNLGYEVALDLLNRKMRVIPLLRNAGKIPQFFKKNNFDYVIEDDLEGDSKIEFGGYHADLILHCAGNVHLKKAKGINEKMIGKLIALAKEQQTPLHFVSTAFVYRAPDTDIAFNNNYEFDKYNSEQALLNSGVTYSIFRPSVLVGNSKTGTIQNFTGYYSIVKALLQYINNSKRRNKKMRIPRFSGHSDIIPVDQVARSIVDIIQQKKLGEFFITNPHPPKASWLLDETINFFGINEFIQVLNCAYEEFGKLDLADDEKNFYDFCRHFRPYWSTDYMFPDSVCKENLINHDYMTTALTYFAKSNALS